MALLLWPEQPLPKLKAAAATFAKGIQRFFTMACGDNITIFIIGNRHDLVHILNQIRWSGQPHPVSSIWLALNHLAAHVMTHRHHTFQTRRTGSSLPPVSILARYLTGMRMSSKSGIMPSLRVGIFLARPLTEPGIAAEYTKPSAMSDILGAAGKPLSSQSPFYKQGNFEPLLSSCQEYRHGALAR
jgi:hypothetical protein